MKRSDFLGTAVLLMAGLSVGPAPALAAETSPSRSRPEMLYFLPKTVVSVTIEQELLACPDPQAPDTNAGKPRIRSAINISQRSQADYASPVTIDARAGVFAKRQVKLALNPDGTLSGFSSSVEGQGGKFVETLITKILPFVLQLEGSAPNPGRIIACSASMVDKLARKRTLRDGISGLEKLVLQGTATPDQVDLLSQHRSELADVIASLTVSNSVKLEAEATAPVRLDNPGVLDWFTIDVCKDIKACKPQERLPSITLADLAKFDVPGSAGINVTLTANKDAKTALGTGNYNGDKNKPTPNFLFRRPVAAAVKAEEIVSASTSRQPLSETARVGLLQLSGLWALPVGRGGMFGSRQGEVAFDANGAPTKIEYGTVGMASEATAIVGALGDQAAALRDAELNRLKREIALEEARQKLAKLRSGSEDD